MLTNALISLLEKREFISVATCDFKGRPNAAPKFILKVSREHIYLVDYIIGTTYRNLKINHRISLSFVDQRTLQGYQLNGSVQILEKGRLFNKLRKEMDAREIRLTTKHIIEDVRGEAKHDTYEVGISDQYVVFVVAVDEIVEIGSKGDLKRSRKFDK